MPDLLVKIPFSETLRSRTMNFDCGDDEWERPLADWICAPAEDKNGALASIKKGRCQVWLHFNDARELVGYSSLGRSTWEWPGPADARSPISVIPYLAIQKQFWGKPADDPPRYSTQILEHLKYEARQHPDRKPVLGLFVHPSNTRAVRAYENAGFQAYFKKCLEDGVEYQSMFLKLA